MCHGHAPVLSMCAKSCLMAVVCSLPAVVVTKVSPEFKPTILSAPTLYPLVVEYLDPAIHRIRVYPKDLVEAAPREDELDPELELVRERLWMGLEAVWRECLSSATEAVGRDSWQDTRKEGREGPDGRIDKASRGRDGLESRRRWCSKRRGRGCTWGSICGGRRHPARR